MTQLAINNYNSVLTEVSFFFLDYSYNLKLLNWIKELYKTQESTPVQHAECIMSKLQHTTKWTQAAITDTQQTQEKYSNYHRKPIIYFKVGDKV